MVGRDAAVVMRTGLEFGRVLFGSVEGVVGWGFRGRGVGGCDWVFESFWHHP